MRLSFFRKLLLSFCCVCVVSLSAQDSAVLRLSLSDAERLLREKNLSLIAEHYNVDIMSAKVVQANVFNNPSFYVEHNIYNPVRKSVFPFGTNSESVLSLTQVLNLAAQRSKAVRVAKMQASISVYEYDALARSLKSELTRTFVHIYFTSKILSIYTQQIAALSMLVESMKEQEKKGDISMIERVRLEAFLLDLRTEKNALLQDYTRDKKNLNLLLVLPANDEVMPLIEDEQLATWDIASLSFAKMTDLAHAREDVRIASTSLDMAKANVVLQKSMRAPSFSIGVNYDKIGNDYPNYTGLNASLSLPFFDRNQGNIKAARAAVLQAQIQKQYTSERVDNEVRIAYEQLENTCQLLHETNLDLEKQFTQLLDGIMDNFKKRNISMLQFLDYYASYKDALIQLYEVKKNVLLAMDNLNFIIGSPVIDLSFRTPAP